MDPRSVSRRPCRDRGGHAAARRAPSRHRPHRQGRFPAADAGAEACQDLRRAPQRPRLCPAARAPRGTLVDPRGRDRLFRHRLPLRQRPLAERERPRARSRARPRPQRRQRSDRARLPDARAPDLSHRLVRRGWPLVPQDGEVGRGLGAGQLDDDLQRDAEAPAGSAALPVRGHAHRPARRGAGRPEAVARHPRLQLARRASIRAVRAALHRVRPAASPRCRR